MTHRILRLEAENVLRLSAVEITPGDGAVVVIGGNNAQGKTSVLNAIEMALGGGKSIPGEPVRRGARKGRVLLDLGDLVVERQFTASGGTTLTVRDGEGVRKSSPQAILDRLCSRVAFDPLSFANAPADKQAETLRALVGLDFTDLDRKRAELYEERQNENRRLRDVQGELRGIAFHPGVEPVDVAALLDELKVLQDANAARVEAERDEAGAESRYQTVVKRTHELQAEIKRLQEELRDVEAEVDAHAVVARSARELLAALPPHRDDADLREKVRTAGEQNRKADENKRYEQHRARVTELQQRSDKLTRQIEQVDDDKRATVAAAAYPVPGLGFDVSGAVTFGGLPLAWPWDSPRTPTFACFSCVTAPSWTRTRWRNFPRSRRSTTRNCGSNGSATATRARS